MIFHKENVINVGKSSIGYDAHAIREIIFKILPKNLVQ